VPAATVLASVSTESVRPAERLPFWEHHNAEALVGLTCSTYAEEGLLARQVNLDLGGFRVADIAGNAHVIERTPALVRARPKDAVFVSLVLEGDAFFYDAGGCTTLGAGDVVVYGTDRPYLFGFGSAMRQLLVDLPEELFTARCAPVPAAPVRISGDGPGTAGVAARALRRLLRGLVEEPGALPDTTGDRLLELLRTATTGAGTDPAAVRLLAAKEQVGRQLRNPRLTPDAVARAVGVTPRHLNRAFAAEGTTLARYIQARRLDGARAELTGPAGGRARIADVAHGWGFASQAHFARLFRARFGCPPSEARTGAGAS
jgi:AraC-like DNA-binding protein